MLLLISLIELSFASFSGRCCRRLKRCCGRILNRTSQGRLQQSQLRMPAAADESFEMPAAAAADQSLAEQFFEIPAADQLLVEQFFDVEDAAAISPVVQVDHAVEPTVVEQLIEQPAAASAAAASAAAAGLQLEPEPELEADVESGLNIRVRLIKPEHLLTDPFLDQRLRQTLLLRPQLKTIVNILNNFSDENRKIFNQLPNGQLEFDHEQEKLVDVMADLVQKEYLCARNNRDDYEELIGLSNHLILIKRQNILEFSRVRAELDKQFNF